MECKVIDSSSILKSFSIRIEPDWNVKRISRWSRRTYCNIRIEPDWNVKIKIDLYICIGFAIRIEPDWNVKKGKQSVTSQVQTIRIEPDWNVKLKEWEK